MKTLTLLVALLFVGAGCGSPQKPPVPIPPSPPTPPTAYPNLAGHYYGGFIGDTTQGFYLEPSTACESLGLSAITGCYQARPVACSGSYGTCLEWGGGICTGNNGTNPIVTSLVFGQSDDQVSFLLNASVLTSQEGGAPNFSVLGTGTIMTSSPLQIYGTWNVINPTKACSITTEAWTVVQQ